MPFGANTVPTSVVEGLPLRGAVDDLALEADAGVRAAGPIVIVTMVAAAGDERQRSQRCEKRAHQ